MRKTQTDHTEEQNQKGVIIIIDLILHRCRVVHHRTLYRT